MGVISSFSRLFRRPNSEQPSAGPKSAHPRPELQQVNIPRAVSRRRGRTIAIDFETANASRTSPCAIGLAWIEDGEISQTAYRLIRPKENRFDPLNIDVHGIEPEDVKHEPEFPQVWEELLPHFDGAFLIAHNAAFDMDVLQRTLDLYGLRCPTISCFCTMVGARYLWPDLPDHRLPTVANHVGFTFSHHHAAEDAAACAKIALEQARIVGVGDLPKLAPAIESRFGQTHGASRASSGKIRRKPKFKPAEIRTSKTEFDEEHPLFGKRVVFTGEISCLTRRQAATLVVDRGGVFQNGVTKHTDYLVVAEAPGAEKIEKAKALQSKGGHIEIISEADFLRLVGMTEE